MDHLLRLGALRASTTLYSLSSEDFCFSGFLYSLEFLVCHKNSNSFEINYQNKLRSPKIEFSLTTRKKINVVRYVNYKIFQTPGLFSVEKLADKLLYLKNMRFFSKNIFLYRRSSLLIFLFCLKLTFFFF